MSKEKLTLEQLADNSLLEAKIAQREVEIRPLLETAISLGKAKDKANEDYNVAYKKYLDFYKGTLELKQAIK